MAADVIAGCCFTLSRVVHSSEVFVSLCSRCRALSSYLMSLVCYFYEVFGVASVEEPTGEFSRCSRVDLRG